MNGPLPSGRKKSNVDPEFFRFPSTPHIAWLGQDLPRDDKLMSPGEVQKLLSEEVVVEEKLDGANLGISISPDGEIRVQNRGQYLQQPYIGQFDKLAAWLQAREEALFDALDEHLLLFGEWCAARHSLAYESLPDWFLAFDVYDRQQGAFWSTQRRNRLAGKLGLAVVPQLMSGHFSKPQLIQSLAKQASTYRQGPLEGFVVRKENQDWLEMRGKLVKAEFVQSITEHWSRRALEWNRIDWSKIAHDS